MDFFFASLLLHAVRRQKGCMIGHLRKDCLSEA